MRCLQRLAGSAALAALVRGSVALAQPAPVPAADSAAPPAASPPPDPSAVTPSAPMPSQPAAGQSPGGAAPPPVYVPPWPGYPGYPYPPYAYGAPPPAPPPPPPAPPVRNVSLTLSPIHLIFPFLELMGEVRLANHIGAAVIGGYGEIPVSNALETVKVSVYEIGGQFAAYPIDAFDDLHLGVEVMYLGARASAPSGDIKTAAARGLALGPLVGYKLVTGVGFTFLAQGGFEYVAAWAEGSDDSGNTTSEASDDDVIPLLNLNLGWTF